MSITVTTEKQFESDIEAFLISAEGGYTKGNGTYNSKPGLFPDKLIADVKECESSTDFIPFKSHLRGQDRYFCIRLCK